MFTQIPRTALAVGLKETKKAIAAGSKKVYIACDAPDYIKNELSALCPDRLSEVVTMRELGAMCGINVNASCAAVKPDGTN